MAIIGIDLGTTNSLVAVWQNSQVEIIPNALGDLLTPSAVSLDDEGQMMVGNTAKDRLVTHPQLSAAYFKRMMGSNKKTTLGKKEFSPEELSALVLRQLKADAEEYLGEPVEEAIISVPAYFNDNQRNATKIAAELAGLKVERLINEPTAAALAYGINEKSGDQTFIVIDLGGGTLDVSIMEKFDNLMEVHASAGDSFLGGEDFTEKMVRDFCDQQETDFNLLLPQDKARLYHRLNLLKHQLSDQKLVETTLILDDKEIPYSLTLDQFTTQMDGLLKRILEPIEKSIRDASIKTADLNDVILVGGASRMPIIRQFVTRLFGRFPSCRLDPDQVVVMGAAIQGALKHRNEDLEDIVLTDVCPFSMGIKIVGDLDQHQPMDFLFSVILERNLVIPCSREQSFHTASDDQKKIDVEIYQGEHRLVKNNIKLGSCTVKVPKKKMGEEWVSVRFTYDINGLLEVLVKVRSTGEEKRMVIKNSSNRMSDAEIAKALKNLDGIKIHPRDKAVNQALLSRAERLFQERLGSERDYISAVTSQFESVLNTQDEKIIEKESSAFRDVLDSMERDIWE